MVRSVRSLALILAIGAGCAHMPSAGQLIAVGSDVLTCAPAESESVRRALTNGGWDWLSVILDAIKCVPAIVKSLESPPMLADAGAIPQLQPALSKRARTRIATAKVLSDVILSRVAP
jgi:hypothetical protein